MAFSGTNTIISGYSGNSTIVNSTANTFSSVGNATLYLGMSGIISINGDMSGFSGTLSLGNSSGTLRLNSNSASSQDVNMGSANTLFDLGVNTGTLSNRNGNLPFNLGRCRAARTLT